MGFSPDRFKQAYEQAGLTIPGLAIKSKVAESGLYRLQKGQGSPPSSRILDKIAAATGKPIEFFFSDEPSAVPEASTPEASTEPPAVAFVEGQTEATLLTALLADHREERRALLAQLEQANQERSRLLSMLEATQREREGWQSLLDRGQQERLGWQRLLGAETSYIPARWETGEPPSRDSDAPPLPAEAATGPLKSSPPPSSERMIKRAAMRTKTPQTPEK